MKKIDVTELANNQSVKSLIEAYESLAAILELASQTVSNENQANHDAHVLNMIRQEIAIKYETRNTKKNGGAK